MSETCTCAVSGCSGAGEPLPSQPTLFHRNYRPSGSLARALYYRQMNDEELRRIDRRQWYRVGLDALPAHARASFLQMESDPDTEAFLMDAEEKSSRVFSQLWHSVCKLLLGWFFTQTSLNGILGRGSMFVFSTAQFGILMERSRIRSGGRLLDLGAGDGAVTEHMAHQFDEVYVTEISGPMRRILSRRGYRTMEIEEWVQPDAWDVISCLNVLDRCAQPQKLLNDMKHSLRSDGVAVIALVLPYKPYVEVGGTANHQPEQRLPIGGETFEEQATSVIKHVLEPNGFVVDTWTRLPYLCEGDLHQAYYWLFDAVFIVRVKSS